MPNQPRFLMQDGQAVFDGDICLYLSRAAAERHADGTLPAYYFRILRLSDGERMGWIDLRAGYLADTDTYGHLSYCLFRPYRGRGYMTRAVQLLLPLAVRHGMKHLYINVATDNTASQGVCRRVGAVYDSDAVQPDGSTRLSFRLDL